MPRSGGAPAGPPALCVEGLSVWFRTPGGAVQALRDASFSLTPGETLVVIGESGSGKTVLAHALMRLLQRNTAVTGRVTLGATSLLDLSDRAMGEVRRRRLALIPQSAGAALNPVRRVGSLLLESAQARGLAPDVARHQLTALLDEMGLRFAEVADRFPHELSGGMQQRVVNAAAMLGRPELVIADEPTFGLDADLVETTAHHLRAITARGAALLLITHDLRLAERLEGRIAVIYASYLVELQSTAAFFAGVRRPPWLAGEALLGPAHPYSRALLRAMPEFGGRPIPGPSPELSALPEGCPFVERCPDRLPHCAGAVPEPYALPVTPLGVAAPPEPTVRPGAVVHPVATAPPAEAVHPETTAHSGATAHPAANAFVRCFLHAPR